MKGGQFITTLYYADCAAYVAEIDAVAAGLAQAYPTMDGPTRAVALQLSHSLARLRKRLAEPRQHTRKKRNENTNRPRSGATHRPDHDPEAKQRAAEGPTPRTRTRHTVRRVPTAPTRR